MPINASMDGLSPAAVSAVSSTVDLAPYTTFRTHATAVALWTLTATQQLAELADFLAGREFIVLGGGSNVLFADDYAGVVVVNRLLGCEVLSQDSDSARVRLGAGENWHTAVVTMSERGFYGLENLALIPGTVGAAPVQNIGAYGVEVADVIESVEVFDLKDKCYKTLDNADCAFGYRDSIFKRPDSRQRRIITAVTLRLSKHFAPNLSYQGLCADGQPSTPKALLARVIAVRQSKLPDPDKLPNAGSFFKNPLVNRQQLQALQLRYPDIPYFDIDDEQVKIPAAWLLQTAGFKGWRTDSGAGVYEKHALIVVNRARAHGRDIAALAKHIMTQVKAQFGIDILPEVRIIGQSVAGIDTAETRVDG